MERVDRLQRTQRCVELRRMPVEGIEGGLDALLLVALLGQRQVLHPRQRLPRGRLRSGPGLVLHHLRLCGSGGLRTFQAADRPEDEAGNKANDDRERGQRQGRLAGDQTAA